MSRAWKRVAKWADNDAFSLGEVHEALGSALLTDCGAEISPALLRDVRAALDERATLLFKSDVGAVVDTFRSSATSSLDGAVLDNLCVLSAGDIGDADLLLSALAAVVTDRAACCARQAEEHYLRKGGSDRAEHLRDRFELAIMTMPAHQVAAAVLNPEQKKKKATRKRRGVDDGVELP
jgi:hypothetical protein